MMKAYIVTVYNSLNPGSFLQASSLYKAVEGIGCDVAFYEAGVRSLRKQAFIEILYLLKNGDFTSVKSKLQLAKIYIQELKKYNITKNLDKTSGIYILGSDEIWNVARENMAKHHILWGEGLDYSRTISYAPSINNATEDDLKRFSFVKTALQNMHSISVRDKHSKETLEKMTQKAITEVCDPTVLVYPEAYENINNNCICKDYILIYIYNKSVVDEDIEAIKRFAKKNGKKLVAFGSTQRWCDIYVNGSPQDFLMYIKYADYVCTSTFHGTMLSIIMNKQFAVLGKKNRKVQELMESVGLDRQATKDTLDNVLETVYDYDKVNERLLEMKNNGLDFLETNIANMGF